MDFFIDIGAEKLLTAQKGNQKIAVEIKTFGNLSNIYEFYTAIGQYIAYKEALEGKNRKLFLAIPYKKYSSFFQKLFIQTILRKNKIPMIVFKPEVEEIYKWIQ